MLNRIAGLCFFLLPAVGLLGSPHRGYSAAATQPAEQVARWFSDLSHPDASIREQARYALMGISRENLAQLRILVEKNRPLAPSQVMALREIVLQVYQATETYQHLKGQSGFLGIQLQSPILIINGVDPDNEAGVLVVDRIAGFCGFRSLQNGDVIQSIREVSDRPLHNSQELTDLLSASGAGSTLHLKVLRGGVAMEVPVTLDARPAWAPLPLPPGQVAGPQQGNTIIEPRQERQRRAEEYWNQNFASLLELDLL